MTLQKKLNDFNFLGKGINFIKKGAITFPTEQEANDFFFSFLMVQCISGVHCTETEFEETSRSLQKLIEEKKSSNINSEELPILKRKLIKELDHVVYSCNGTMCTWEKDCQ